VVAAAVLGALVAAEVAARLAAATSLGLGARRAVYAVVLVVLGTVAVTLARRRIAPAPPWGGVAVAAGVAALAVATAILLGT
jgi:hypothetical protein